MLSRIFRFFLLAVLAGWVIRLLLRWLTSARSAATPSEAPPVPKPVPLHRDPVCGTFVSPEVSFRLEEAGRVEHFCSAECRDRYLRRERRAAGA